MELYLLSGDDQYEKEKYLDKIKSKFGSLKKGINYLVIDKDNIDMLEQELSTYSFFNPDKFILVKVPKKLKEESSNKDWLNDGLINLLSSNLANICLVFIDEGSGKGKLSNVVKKYGEVISFEKNKKENLNSWIMEICKESNVVIQQKDITYLIQLSGTDKYVIYQELKKLIDYCGNSSVIDKDVIDRLCIKTSEVIIFDLTDALGKKNVKAALKYFYDLLENGEPIQKIMIMITKHFKMLLLAKVAYDEKKDLSKELGVNPYAARKYMEQSRNFSTEELFKLFDDFCKLDIDSKIGKIDLKIGMEKIFVSL